MKKMAVLSIVALVGLSAFVVNRKSKLKISEEYVKVPGGTMYMGGENDPPHQFDPAKRVTIPAFYISKYEVSNQQYREFYAEIAAGLSEAERIKIACDTLAWEEAIHYSEPMMKYYYNHPAYNSYPVVNVSYEGALAYCQWLQQKLQQQNPNHEITVSLPKKIQWIWAAQGGRSQAMYPWGNYYLRNKKGEFMCNFKRVGDQAIYRNKKTGKPEVADVSDGSIAGGLNDRALYTAQVKSYYPNDFGLYNICGNAAEMIVEKGIAMGGSWNDYGGDVHIRSQAEYIKPLPTVGFRPVIVVKEKN